MSMLFILALIPSLYLSLLCKKYPTKPKWLLSDSNPNTEKVVAADVIDGWSKERYQWFLDNYWQKKPLLIRNALSRDKVTQYTQDDVLLLSSDEDVESRLICRK